MLSEDENMPKAIMYLVSPQATDRFLNNIKQMTKNHNSEQQMQSLLMLSLDEWKLLLLLLLSRLSCVRLCATP